MSNPTEEMLRYELAQARKEIEELKAERDLLQSLVDTMTAVRQ
jgi:hypothetical protein